MRINPAAAVQSHLPWFWTHEEWEEDRKKKHLVHKAGRERWNNPKLGYALQAALKLPVPTEGMFLSKNNLLLPAQP